MLNVYRPILAALVAFSCGIGSLAAQTAVNQDAVTMQDFKKRIDEYMKVHGQAAKEAPPLKQTHDPAEIKQAQSGIADRIRALRADAKEGDIFAPPIAARFKELVSPPLKGSSGKDAKEILKDDAPAPGEVPLKVNAKYPTGAPLPTVPSKLLLNLPMLPKALEYRIIGKNLILRDVDADLIVDFIPKAIS